MLRIAVALLNWLPTIFDLGLVPIALTLAVIALWRRTRSRLALGLMIAAATAAIFLSVETAALVYVCCDQARVILSILLDFRPGVTAGFVAALLGSIGAPLLRLLPMLIAGACAGGAAFAVRRKSGSMSGLRAESATIVEPTS